MSVIEFPQQKNVPHVSINPNLCKGCGLCVKFCPKKILHLGKTINTLGYEAVECDPSGCTGCGNCFYICPEPEALSVQRKVSISLPQIRQKKSA